MSVIRESGVSLAGINNNEAAARFFDAARFTGDSKVLSLADAIYKEVVYYVLARCQEDGRCQQGNRRWSVYLADEAATNTEASARSLLNTYVLEADRTSVEQRARRFLDDAKRFVSGGR